MKENKSDQINELLEEGIGLYEQKNFNEAEKIFKKGIEKCPESETLMYNLALVYFEQKKYESSFELVNKINKLNCNELILELIKIDEKYNAPTHKKLKSFISGLLLVFVSISALSIPTGNPEIPSLYSLVFSLFILYAGIKALFFRLRLVKEISIFAAVITIIGIIIGIYAPPSTIQRVGLLIFCVPGFMFSLISIILIRDIKT